MRKILALLFLLKASTSLPFETKEILFPTANSTNLLCKNHTRFYMEELKNSKLWATEMYDASSMSPTGVLFGSSYNFGNFDECLEITIPLEDASKLNGQYCLARFQLEPPLQKSELTFQDFGGNFFEGANYANVSTWEKIEAFKDEKFRRTRDEFYLSYCIPASCSHDDLETSLQQILGKGHSGVKVSVEPVHCQVNTKITLDPSDIIFLVLVAFFMLLVAFATLYDRILRSGSMEKIKLSGTKHNVVLAFSSWTNVEKLVSDSQENDGLECVHCLKVITMFLVIMGHRFMYNIGGPLLNPNFVESLYGRIEATVLFNGTIIVNTFFNLSGFLACYLLLADKRKANNNIFLVYLHRFIRLTPAYAIVLFFYCTIFIKLDSGPLWTERIGTERDRCLASWWANLLYLNNYIQTDKICMMQTWYLACDMHYFLLAPILVYLLKKSSKIGITALLGIITLSVLTNFIIVYAKNEEGIFLIHMGIYRDPTLGDNFKNVYIPSHMRASPYFVGMFAGYIKYKLRTTDMKINRYMVYFGWILCIVVVEITSYVGFLFYIPDRPYDPLVSALYGALHQFTWSVCICWIVLAVSEGRGEWIRQFLSFKVWVSLSRLTYTAFLCHDLLQQFSMAILRYGNYISIPAMGFAVGGDLVLTYVLALILSMIFEAPFIRLEKIVYSKRKSRGHPEPTPKSEMINFSKP